MTYTQRWIVTYTKHMKQKRKVYQDGFLELSGSGNKVMLYDDSEKIIDSRFLKKDEVIECGSMLTLEAHLVDVGVLEGNHKPLTNLNVNGRDGNLNERAAKQDKKDTNKITSKSGLLQNYSRTARCKPKVSNKNEFGSSGEAQVHPSATETTAKAFVEWNVLYTTQKTQKAKKYHDGTLRLALCGSYMKQITLLSEDGVVLSSKFLKSVESVEIGNKYELPNYLVEVCEERTTQKDDRHKTALEQVASSNSSSNSKFTTEEKLPKDGLQKYHFEQVDSGSSNIGTFRNSTKLPSNQPLRNACQIISVLKKPLPKENFELRKLSVETHSLSTTNAILLDVPSESNTELDMQGMKYFAKSDNQECDSGSGATQTNTSRSLLVKLEASEEVPTSAVTVIIDTDSEDKSVSDDVSIFNELTGQVAPDALEIRSVMESSHKNYVDQTTSTSGVEVSDTDSWISSETSKQIACQPVYGLSAKMASPRNGMHPADPLSSHLENTSILCGMNGSGIPSLCESKYENGNQIPENNKEEKGESARLLDASSSVDVTCEDIELQTLSKLHPIMDGIPSFDLGF